MVFLDGLSLRLKIVGLVAALLSIMLLAALFSHVKTLASQSKITDVNELLVPTLRHLQQIEANTLRQKAQFEQSLRFRMQTSTDARRNAERASLFEELGRNVSTEAALGLRQITTALDRVSSIGDAIALARIQPQLNQIVGKHNYYAEIAKALLVSHTPTSDPKFRRNLDEVYALERQIHTELSALVTNLEEFVSAEFGKVTVREQERTILSWESLALAFGAFVFGTLLALLIANRILRPIRALQTSAAAVSKGDLDVEVSVATQDEVGDLANSFNLMVTGLRDRDRIKQTFSRYVDPRVVAHLLSPGAADHEGDRREMTVFFSDIADFTSISEQLTPAHLVRLINAYLAQMSKPISELDGVIDKFVGDAIMAFWGAPFVRDADQAQLACRAALASRDQLEVFQQQVPDILGLRVGAPEIRIRIGIATGPVTVGNIGSETMRSYTLMGDSVNVASRLEGACKQYGLSMLVSETTADRVGKDILLREIDAIGVKGKAEPTRVFEPLALSGESKSAKFKLLAETFAAALAAYRRQDWDEAEAGFENANSVFDSDPASHVFLERIRVLRDQSPDVDWDGVWRLTNK